MAILVVAQAPGMTAEQDAALAEALDLEGSPPAGGIIRMAGPTVDGWRRTLQVERFGQGRVLFGRHARGLSHYQDRHLQALLTGAGTG